MIVWYGENDEYWYAPSNEDIECVLRRELKRLSNEELIDIILQEYSFDELAEEYREEISDYCFNNYKEDIYNG